MRCYLLNFQDYLTSGTWCFLTHHGHILRKIRFFLNTPSDVFGFGEKSFAEGRKHYYTPAVKKVSFSRTFYMVKK